MLFAFNRKRIIHHGPGFSDIIPFRAKDSVFKILFFEGHFDPYRGTERIISVKYLFGCEVA